jgi:hypothetical protein
MRKFKHKITGFIATETNSGKNYKVFEKHNYTIPTWVIVNSNDWEDISDFNCQKSEYPISYENLCNGDFYTTEYPDQGLYTFKHGYDLWYNHSSMQKHTSDSNFNPKNGFHFFRKSTKKEIDFLTPSCFSDEWEILSVIKTKGSKNFIPIMNGAGKHYTMYSGVVTCTLKELIIDRNFLIYQVKRNSDGEVFKIGDRIKGYKNTGIKKINLVGGKIEIVTDANGDGCVTDAISFQLKNCIKLKNPLFKTVDDIDIFEGDYFYEANQIHGVKKWNTEYPVYLNKDILKTLFYKKENAEEYYLLNRPCLSIKDVQSIYVSANGSYKKNGDGHNYLDKLKEIVKNK